MYIFDVGFLEANVIVKHLVGLNFISQVFCHSSSFIRSFWRIEMLLSDLTGRYSRQSSAKR